MKTKVILAGTMVTFYSPNKLETLKEVAKFKPSALTLLNENKEPEFDVLPVSCGVITNKMIGYADEAPDGTGRACLSVPIPEIAGKTPAQAVAEVYGPIIVKADAVEDQIAAAMGEISEMLNEVEEAIEIAGAAAATNATAATDDSAEETIPQF